MEKSTEPTDVRQLEQLEWMFFATVRRMERCVDLHSRILEKKYGLTVPQLHVLWIASEGEGTPIGRLAALTGLSGATLTGIVDRLEDHGLARRVRSADDKRQVLVVTTSRGRATLAERPRPFSARFIERLGEMASWERTRLLSQVQHVADMMEGEESPDEVLED